MNKKIYQQLKGTIWEYDYQIVELSNRLDKVNSQIEDLEDEKADIELQIKVLKGAIDKVESLFELEDNKTE